ncbi:mediator complex subunit 19 [Brevipalpus obovatus]|uniref:mediator complex subunit 19 n=1 Tax=Brevipalpus obovatus TaxID=246614 RepID=UPI003D9F62EC
MIAEGVRRNNGESFSPKASPRGNRSPLVNNRQDTTGTLKTTICLGKTPTIVHSGPFYLMKDLGYENEITGATNLIRQYNLEHSYNKFCCGRKIKDHLSAFLPNLPGNIDVPASPEDNSSLRSLIEKPPICGREILPLTSNQLSGFRLHQGPIPEQYRFMSQPIVKKKHKSKKSKNKMDETPNRQSQLEIFETNSSSGHEKKHKKQRKHEDEKERKKKKKDKKKKRKHSPESGNASVHSASPFT